MGEIGGAVGDFGSRPAKTGRPKRPSPAKTGRPKRLSPA